MLVRIVLFTIIFLATVTSSFSFAMMIDGYVEQVDRPIIIARSTSEVTEMMEYNGPWLVDTVTILIETSWNTSLNSLTQKINDSELLEGTELEWTMLLEQNIE